MHEYRQGQKKIALRRSEEYTTVFCSARHDSIWKEGKPHVSIKKLNEMGKVEVFNSYISFL